MRQELDWQVLVSQHKMCGTSLMVAVGGISNNARPSWAIRLIASLGYLKHSFNLSEWELVFRWVEN